MSGEKYYKLFGLTKDCSELDIRRRYKELAKIYHPDSNNSKDSHDKFIELQIAYDYLLNQIKGPRKLIEKNLFQEDRTKENEWILYRKRAYEKYREKVNKEKKELENWILKIDTGWRKGILYLIAFVGVNIALLLILDNFLPEIKTEEKVVKYSTLKYKSMNGKPVSIVQTENLNSYWLNNFNNNYFDKLPHTSLIQTAIFKHPKKMIVQSGAEINHVPIHFTLYWGQIVYYMLVLIPIIAVLYKKRDVFKIMFYYTTIYGFGGFLIYFLLTNNRLFNMISYLLN